LTSPHDGPKKLLVGTATDPSAPSSSIRHVHAGLQNLDRIAYFRRRILKDNNLTPTTNADSGFKEFLEFQAAHPNFVVKADWQLSRVCISMTLKEITESVIEVSHGGCFLTDATYDFAKELYLISTTSFNDLTSRWIIILASLVRSLNADGYEAHFHSLFKIFGLPEANETKGWIGMVVDFSKAQHNGFCAAYAKEKMRIEKSNLDPKKQHSLYEQFYLAYKTEAKSYLKGCKFHWRKSIESICKIKDIVLPELTNTFKALCYRMVNTESRKTMSECIAEIDQQFPGTRSWIRWWLHHDIGGMLFKANNTLTPALQDDPNNTSNAQESLYRDLYRTARVHQSIVEAGTSMFLYMHNTVENIKAVKAGKKIRYGKCISMKLPPYLADSKEDLIQDQDYSISKPPTALRKKRGRPISNRKNEPKSGYRAPDTAAQLLESQTEDLEPPSAKKPRTKRRVDNMDNSMVVQEGIIRHSTTKITMETKRNVKNSKTFGQIKAIKPTKPTEKFTPITGEHTMKDVVISNTSTAIIPPFTISTRSNYPYPLDLCPRHMELTKNCCWIDALGEAILPTIARRLFDQNMNPIFEPSRDSAKVDNLLIDIIRNKYKNHNTPLATTQLRRFAWDELKLYKPGQLGVSTRFLFALIGRMGDDLRMCFITERMLFLECEKGHSLDLTNTFEQSLSAIESISFTRWNAELAQGATTPATLEEKIYDFINITKSFSQQCHIPSCKGKARSVRKVGSLCSKYIFTNDVKIYIQVSHFPDILCIEPSMGSEDIAKTVAASFAFPETILLKTPLASYHYSICSKILCTERNGLHFYTNVFLRSKTEEGVFSIDNTKFPAARLSSEGREPLSHIDPFTHAVFYELIDTKYV
jgi:hypothetical protein